MMRVFGALITLVLHVAFARAAHAVMPFAQLQPTEAAISKVKYIPAQEGLNDLRMPLNMLAASPKLEIVDGAGNVVDHCSGSVVSDDGTVLTAGHCVEQCLARGKAIIKIDGISAVDRARLNDIQCNFRINGHIVSAKILATNDCRGEDKMAASTVNIQCNGLDYAVLKIEDRSLRSQPCFQVSSEAPTRPGTGVAAIGYPPLTARQVYQQGARDSDGVGSFLTPGETIPYQNYCRQPTDAKRGEKASDGKLDFNAKFAATLKKQVDGGHVLQTSTDVLRGVSGAGLANVNSYKLVGVARSTIHNNPNKECVGSGFYTSTSSILASIKNDYPHLSLSETFRCDKNAFAPQNETPSPSLSPANVQPLPKPEIAR